MWQSHQPSVRECKASLSSWGASSPGDPHLRAGVRDAASMGLISSLPSTSPPTGHSHPLVVEAASLLSGDSGGTHGQLIGLTVSQLHSTGSVSGSWKMCLHSPQGCVAYY